MKFKKIVFEFKMNKKFARRFWSKRDYYFQTEGVHASIPEYQMAAPTAAHPNSALKCCLLQIAFNPNKKIQAKTNINNQLTLKIIIRPG